MQLHPALFETGLTSSCETGFSSAETGFNGLTKPVSMNTGFTETGLVAFVIGVGFGFRF